MDLDGIVIFVKVVQAGSFSKAAALLGIPNSTVSAKVAALEKRLGITLLQRTTRKLHATQAGEAYFRRCVQALEELTAAENELATARGEPNGVLRLTAPVEFGHNLLPALVDAFMKRHTRVDVELVITNRLIDLVAENVDLAVRAGSLKDSALIARRFELGHFGFWASPTYLKQHPPPAHPRELAQHECMKFSRFDGKGVQLSNGREQARITLAGRIMADDFEALRALAVHGRGIAFLPSFLCNERVQERKLVPVLPDWRGEAVAVSLVYPAQRFVAPKVRAFIEVASELWHWSKP
ncbi:MAG TPA: LysR family transcriptional regulator [Terriglobales bacterium]|nr:LysR family transcriptional regulator [Terriglobales bacterium]